MPTPDTGRFTLSLFGVRAQPFSGTSGAFSLATLSAETGLIADQVIGKGVGCEV